MDKTLDEVLNELHYMALAHIAGTHASDDVHVKEAKKALQELVKECLPALEDEGEPGSFNVGWNWAIEDITKALRERGLL